MDPHETPGALDTGPVEVRTLCTEDLGWVVQVDKQYGGESRRGYYSLKLRQAEQDTGVHISLAAVVDGIPAGFLLGRLYYGEFGVPEPVAILDSIGVSRDFAGRKVAKALMRQLCMNLAGLHVDTIQTLVSWDQLDLMGFFQRAGFAPAPRFCLEMSVVRPES